MPWGWRAGWTLDTIAARLAEMPRVPGRLNPLPGRRGSLLLDDSYSASPAAVEAALETLAALDARHRIAVLGDMLELGDYETTGHERVGRQAARVLDLLVTKGNRARSIADAARAAGMPADQVIVTYTPEDAARAVLERLAPGDVALVKGSLATRMEQVVRLLMDEPHLAPDLLVRQDAAWQQIVTISPDRPTWLEIDLGAIAHNVRRLKQIAGEAQLMISLKADAYGHGAIQVAQTALLNGATWLGVACLSEGLALRQAGIRAPILVLGYTPAWQARDVLRHDLTATVFDLDVARAFSRAALALDRPAHVHVKVDTGMGRLGVFPDQALAFIRTLRELPGLVVEGIFTHLSVADGTSDWEQAYSAEQLAAFDRVLADLAAAGIRIPLVHAENSAAFLRTRGHGYTTRRYSDHAALTFHASALRITYQFHESRFHARPPRHRRLRPRPIAADPLPAGLPARVGLEDPGGPGEGVAAGQLRRLRCDLPHLRLRAHRGDPRRLCGRLPPRAAPLGRSAGARPARADHRAGLHGSDDDQRDPHPRRPAG